MIRNVLISVGSFGVPLAILGAWTLIALGRARQNEDPQRLLLYLFTLPMIAVTSWLVLRGPPRSALGIVTLLVVSPGIGLVGVLVA